MKKVYEQTKKLEKQENELEDMMKGIDNKKVQVQKTFISYNRFL
eukprot:CAMPEP_0170557118 /NCGR_PEP_ID=MMETSP0211-20121228/19208_1 /TAXON_ID=311385 /ORGANISM="Pseudokeronopsis sp., Strain OXSARD2" /LENGTH=43 /DNA_ID= /DNA_START= /DNA_END= /DNA_ORIENTATION=